MVESAARPSQLYKLLIGKIRNNVLMENPFKRVIKKKGTLQSLALSYP